MPSPFLLQLLLCAVYALPFSLFDFVTHAYKTRVFLALTLYLLLIGLASLPLGVVVFLTLPSLSFSSVHLSSPYSLVVLERCVIWLVF